METHQEVITKGYIMKGYEFLKETESQIIGDGLLLYCCYSTSKTTLLPAHNITYLPPFHILMITNLLSQWKSLSIQ